MKQAYILRIKDDDGLIRELVFGCFKQVLTFLRFHPDIGIEEISERFVSLIKKEPTELSQFPHDCFPSSMQLTILTMAAKNA